MRLSRNMMAGAGLGFVLGVAFTIISLFQFNEEETSPGEVVAVGLLIGLPLAVVGGVFLGWLWDVWERSRRR